MYIIVYISKWKNYAERYHNLIHIRTVFIPFITMNQQETSDKQLEINESFSKLLNMLRHLMNEYIYITSSISKR